MEKEIVKAAHFPFTQSNLIVKLRPIKDIRDMSILWTVDPTRNLYRSNPCRLIGFLLGTYTQFVTICLNLLLNTTQPRTPKPVKALWESGVNQISLWSDLLMAILMLPAPVTIILFLIFYLICLIYYSIYCRPQRSGVSIRNITG